MEIIDLSGYVAEEKVQIARTYLIPQVLELSGLTAQQIDLTDDALNTLIKSYCRESGVREGDPKRLLAGGDTWQLPKLSYYK